MSPGTLLRVAGKIAFHYEQKLTKSTVINTEIASSLGEDGYKKFYIALKTKPNKQEDTALQKEFKPEFLNNPVDDKDCISDCEVTENYNLSTLFETMARFAPL